MKFKIIKNIIWLLLERGAQVVGTFVVSGLVSRQLGVVEYGNFQFALAVILIFSTAGLICSTEVLLPKIVIADKKSLNGLIFSGFILRFSASLAAYFLILLYGYFWVNDEQLSSLLYILGLTVFLREPFAVALVYFQSKTYSKPVVIISVFLLTLKILFLSVAYYFDRINFTILCWVWVFEALGLSLGYSFLYFRDLRRAGAVSDWDLTYLRGLFIEGCIYWPPLIAMIIFLRMDRILVKFMSPSYDAGIYLAAMQLFDAIVSIALIVAVSVAPSFIYQYSDAGKIRNNTFKLVFLMLLGGAACAVFGYMFASHIISYIFGPAFLDAIPIVKTAFCVSILVFLDAALNVNLIKRLGAKYALVKWVLVIMVALPVQYLSVRLWGPQGAHFGIGFGYVVALFFGMYQMRLKD
jgi:O-antigen/teichoic acid export membrane protein